MNRLKLDQVLLDHEKLEVYQSSLDFLLVCEAITSHLPRGKGYLIDQLQRAALSISLNIAEGAGEFSVDEKNRFYRMSKRSATECAAILNACMKLNLIEKTVYSEARLLLIKIISMLVKLGRGTLKRNCG